MRKPAVEIPTALGQQQRDALRALLLVPADSMAQLADRMRCDNRWRYWSIRQLDSICRSVRGLEKRGLVIRSKHGRATRCSLTAKGHEIAVTLKMEQNHG